MIFPITKDILKALKDNDVVYISNTELGAVNIFNQLWDNLPESDIMFSGTIFPLFGMTMANGREVNIFPKKEIRRVNTHGDTTTFVENCPEVMDIQALMEKATKEFILVREEDKTRAN
jgi:hypothetical protein